MSAPAPSLRVAVVGAGPAGFYAAAHLLKAGAQVDVYDRLPTPYGLVRAGVAPDHPKIKTVTRVYDKTAREQGFRFFGNVDVGDQITPAELAACYHAVVFSIGATSDRRMGIAGEGLPGSHAATEFVAWYNAHPDFAEREFDLSATRRVAVIGNGNVAIDVARMLALPAGALRATDTADHALAALARSTVEEIVLIGRRGPAQAAFTNPEILELGELPDVDIVVDGTELALDPLSARWLAEDASKTPRINVETLRGYAERPLAGRPRRITFRFLRSPIALHGERRVEEIELERNEITAGDDGRLTTRATGQTERLPVDLVLRSIGYRGTPLPGVPFDEGRGTIPNELGRVLADDGGPLTGLYVAGWIKRGPSGVIGTNRKDAIETAQALLEDAEAGRMPEPTADADDLLAGRCADRVTFAGWDAIDAAECAAGALYGRPRVKLASRAALLATATSA
jgi:ferredoxin--NADP+ reductase